MSFLSFVQCLQNLASHTRNQSQLCVMHPKHLLLVLPGGSYIPDWWKMTLPEDLSIACRITFNANLTSLYSLQRKKMTPVTFSIFLLTVKKVCAAFGY